MDKLEGQFKQTVIWKQVLLLALSVVMVACSQSDQSSGRSRNGSGLDQNSATEKPTAGGQNSVAGGDRYSVGGAIEGLDGYIQLSLNGQVQTFTSSPFVFDTRLPSNTDYSLRFQGAEHIQRCSVENGSGTVEANVDDVVVVCGPAAKSVRFADATPQGPLTDGDFNADGYRDLALAVRTTAKYVDGANRHRVRVLWGDGDGSFRQKLQDLKVTSAPLNATQKSVVAADINDDGFDDVMVAAKNGLDWFLSWSNDELYRPFDALSYSGLNQLFVFDADQDALLDVVAGIYQQGKPIGSLAATFSGDENGRLGSAEPSADASTWASDNGLELSAKTNFLFSDYNSDGLTDGVALFVAENTLRLAYLENDGQGAFHFGDNVQTLATSLKSASSNLHLMAFAQGDLEGDGDVDLVVHAGERYVHTLVNDGTGHFNSGRLISVGHVPKQLLFSDLNTDGISDLISVGESSESLNISWGLGGGVYGAEGDDDSRFTPLLLLAGSVVGEVIVADVDANATPDIVFTELGIQPAGYAAGAVHAILNPGMTP